MSSGNSDAPEDDSARSGSSSLGLRDLTLSDSVSQPTSTECPHGFESCTEYDMRWNFATVPSMNGRVIVTYVKGDPEDEIHTRLLSIIEDKRAAFNALQNGAEKFRSRRLNKMIPLSMAYLFWQKQDAAYSNVQMILNEMVDKRAAHPGKCSPPRTRAG
jgi:hypothetical protein